MNPFPHFFRAAVLWLLLSCAADAGVHTWKGGGGDDYWSNDDNWTGGAPEEDEPGGTILVFPASAQSCVTVCDESYFYVQKMIFRGSYTVKHTDNGDDNAFGINLNTGVSLEIDSTASPTVVFDASTRFIILDSSTIRLTSGTLRMRGDFGGSGYGGIATLEGNGALWLEGSSGSGGSYIINGGTIHLAAPPNSNSRPNPEYIPFSFLVRPSGALRVHEDDQLELSPVTVDGGWFNMEAGAEDTVGPLTIKNSGSVTAQNPGARLELGGTVTASGTDNELDGHLWLGGVTREVNVESGGILDLKGWIEDGAGAVVGGLRKTGDGALLLNYTGYFKGPVAVDGGDAWTSSNSAFGATSGGVTVGTGGCLILEDSQINGESLTIAGSVLADEPDSYWNGPVVLQSTVKQLVVNPFTKLSIFGTISGAGQLAVIGGGTLELGGNITNSYAGGTLVRGGVLRLAKTSGNAIPGSLLVDSLGAPVSSTVVLAADHQIADTSIVQVLGTGAVLDVANHNETIGSLGSPGAGTPEVRLGNARTTFATFTIGANNYTTEFNGRITGADTMTLQKTGSGKLKLGSTGSVNTYAGQTRVLGGIMEVGAQQAIGSAVVSTGATLTGTGTTGLVTLSGGNLHAGRLSTGHVTANVSGGKVLADLLSTTSGGNDQLNVTGTVNLAGTSLIAALNFLPQTGARFVIIKNDGTDAVSGQFAGLSEGANFYISGRLFAISYHGGDGNDVELRFLGTGGPPRIVDVSYNRTQDRIHLVALAPPGVLCHWQVSGTLGGWTNFASGVPDSAGFLELDQTIGLQGDRMFFRLLKP